MRRILISASFRLSQEFKEGMDVWSSLMAAAGGPTFSELLGNGKPIHSSLELLKWIVRPPPHTPLLHHLR
jgi:hypothetical protein